MNNIEQLKRYHIAKVYRRDQPVMTKGRFREFYQCDFDIAGAYEPMVPDAEIIKIMVDSLTALDIGSFKIKINHRKLLDGIFLVAGVPEDKIRAISSAVDKLDKMPWEEVKKEMVQVKGLEEEKADKIGEYVRKAGGKELLEELMKDECLSKNELARQAFSDLTLLFEYTDLFNVTEFVSFDL
ncbi:class II aaRS and biotin synthetase, partial [Rozella allomycis CSF55]